jgi:hypothetical protein
MILDYMRKGYKPEVITEAYVASPPAAYIISTAGNVFSLGFVYQEERDRPTGNYAFNVLVNGYETGEFATFIEKRQGKVRIKVKAGWKVWNGHSFI